MSVCVIWQTPTLWIGIPFLPELLQEGCWDVFWILVLAASAAEDDEDGKK
jgi:hypothetical protein